MTYIGVVGSEDMRGLSSTYQDMRGEHAQKRRCVSCVTWKMIEKCFRRCRTGRMKIEHLFVGLTKAQRLQELLSTRGGREVGDMGMGTHSVSSLVGLMHSRRGRVRESRVVEVAIPKRMGLSGSLYLPLVPINTAPEALWASSVVASSTRRLPAFGGWGPLAYLESIKPEVL